MNIQKRLLVFLAWTIGLVIIGSIISVTYAAEQYTFVRKWGSAGEDNGQFDRPQNVGLGPSNTIYVADTENHRIQNFDTLGNFVTKWGSVCSLYTNDNRCRDPDGSGPLEVGDGQFNRPLDVVVDSTGNVYVTDSLNDRIQKFDANGNFITKWGSQGSGEGQFSIPFGIAIDSSDKVYVDDLTDRVQKFTSNGDFITEWGSQGFGDGQFRNPHGIAIDSSDNVYVVDEANRSVQKFDSRGNFITKWDQPAPGTDGQLFEPFGIDIDSSNMVYIADLGLFLQKFTSDGNFITKWGSEGSEDGQFKGPAGVTVDSSGKVYVADSLNYRIQVFSQVTDTIPLNVTLRDQAICHDVASGGRKGISVSFIIKGLYHVDNTYTAEVRGPDGNILIDELNGLPVSDDLNRFMPRDTPSPSTLFIGKSFATQKFGTFTFVVFGSDGSRSSLPFTVPQCPLDNTPPDTTISSATDGSHNIVDDQGITASNSILFNFDGT